MRLGRGAGGTGLAKVLDGLAPLLGAAQEDGAFAERRHEGQLVEREDLAAGIEDAGTGGLCDAQGGDGELGDGEQTHVVGDGADEHGDLVGLVLEVLAQPGERQGRAVDLAHEQALEHDLVEL